VASFNTKLKLVFHFLGGWVGVEVVVKGKIAASLPGIKIQPFICVACHISDWNNTVYSIALIY
jgi:hypothetical protein